jgi:VIT1/CCC1 family predicted Fe2+/Mn2+ transporter
MGASNYLARRSTVEAQSSREDAFRHAAATIAAFIAAGLVPLVAYLLPLPPDSRFVAAVLLTAATLFSVGAARSFVTGLSPLRSGLEMLLIGALAAVAAYLIGAFASQFTRPDLGSSHTP